MGAWITPALPHAGGRSFLCESAFRAKPQTGLRDLLPTWPEGPWGLQCDWLENDQGSHDEATLVSGILTSTQTQGPEVIMPA